MSSTDSDDVLDNWEEIDEAGLGTQLNQIKKDLKTDDSETTMSFQNNVPLMVVVQQGNEYYSNYAQAAKPAVTILRRPTSVTSSTKQTEIRPKQPIKTLEQREQEYAEARLRILGSAKNPEDEVVDTSTIRKINEIPTMITPPSSSILPPQSTLLQQQQLQYQQQQQQQQQQHALLSSTGKSIAACQTTRMTGDSFTPNNYILNVQTTTTRPQDNNIVRMPRGPNGTTGFNLRR